MLSTHPPAHRQAPQQRGELGYLVGLRTDQPLRDHRRVLVGGRGEQVRDLPVGPDRAFDRLAVDGQRGQQLRSRQWGADRAEPGPGAQVSPRVLSQALGAQGGKDPLDGVGMRRDMAAAAVLAGAHAGQQVLVRVGDPVGDLDQAHASGGHCRGAQSQNGGQPMPDPPFAAGVGDRGETVQQAGPAAAVQQGRPVGQDRYRRRHLRGVVGGGHRGGGGHDRLSRQRSHRF